MNDLAVLTARLHRTRRVLDRQVGEAEAVARHGARAQADITRLSEEHHTLTRAATVLTSIGDERQATTQRQIEDLVTKGLHTIFGDALSFHLVPAIRGNRPEIDFVVRSTLDGSTVDTPVMDARGGGLAAIVGFLLRLVRLLLDTLRAGTVILHLDETFAHVSAEYEPRLAEFIRQMVDHVDMQIIMVTHSDAFSDLADARYRFTLVDGITRIDPA